MTPPDSVRDPSVLTEGDHRVDPRGPPNRRQRGKGRDRQEARRDEGVRGRVDRFDPDEHDTGIFTWPILRDYCEKRDSMWQAYLDKLARAGLSRDP